MKSIVIATFIYSIFVLIGGTVYWQPDSANGREIGAGTSVFTPKVVGDAPMKPGRSYSREGYGHRFG